MVGKLKGEKANPVKHKKWHSFFKITQLEIVIISHYKVFIFKINILKNRGFEKNYLFIYRKQEYEKMCCLHVNTAL